MGAMGSFKLHAPQRNVTHPNFVIICATTVQGTLALIYIALEP